jgi:hypothetical protein
MTTLAVHSLQDVRRRFDPRDFVDLTMQIQHWGAEAFGRLTVKVLDQESRNLPAQADRASPYLHMHRSLGQVTRISETGFEGAGVRVAQAEEVRTTLTAMAEQVARAAPKSRGPSGEALQQLLALPESDRAAMRAWMDAQGIDEAYVRDRVASPAQMARVRSAAVDGPHASPDQQTGIPATPQQEDQGQRAGQQGVQHTGRPAGPR